MVNKIKRFAYHICIIIGIIIIFMPLFLKNGTYDKLVTTPDTITHSAIIEAFTNGNQPYILYPAQRIFGKVLGTLNKVLHLEPAVLFVAFMMLVVVCVGLSFYCLLSHIKGISKAWIALLVVMFCNLSIFALINYGIVYSVINMYIILPLAILSIVKWLSVKKWYYLVSAVILFSIFSYLHPTGIYLRYSIIIMVIGLIIYKLVAWKKVRLTWSIAIIIGLLGINIIFYKYIVKAITILDNNTVNMSFNGMGFLPYFLKDTLTPITIGLGILALIGIIKYCKQLAMSKEVKYLLWILCSFAIALLGGAVLGLGVPDRLWVDSATFVALIIGILLTQIIAKEIENKKITWLSFTSYALVSVGTSSTLITWLN